MPITVHTANPPACTSTAKPNIAKKRSASAHQWTGRCEKPTGVAFFSDAVFAIAMTLLVVGIGIPHVGEGDLGEALSNKDAEIFSFFLSFVVIGFFWLAHHRFFARLAAVDVRFMQLNLLYLAAIAFMPFPTALVGVYGGDEPVVVVLYAVTLGVASLLEAALFVRAAQHEGLLRVRMRDRRVPRQPDGVVGARGRVRDLHPHRVRRVRRGPCSRGS